MTNSRPGIGSFMAPSTTCAIAARQCPRLGLARARLKDPPAAVDHEVSRPNDLSYRGGPLHLLLACINGR
jgi:hypothetical protein